MSVLCVRGEKLLLCAFTYVSTLHIVGHLIKCLQGFKSITFGSSLSHSLNLQSFKDGPDSVRTPCCTNIKNKEPNVMLLTFHNTCTYDVAMTRELNTGNVIQKILL